LRELVLVRPPVVHLKADFYGGIPGIPSGIAYLAASVRAAGFPVRVIDAFGTAPHRFFTFRRRYRARGLTPGEIADLTPRDSIAGISVHCAGEHSMSCSIIRELKARAPFRPVIVGGYHATFVPDDFIAAGADYAVMGEGENRLPGLLAGLERGLGAEGLEGIAGRDGKVERKTRYVVDLDSQPFAAVELLPLENYWKLGYGHGPVMRNVRYMNILTSRGCPYKCSFCQAPEMSGGRWLRKSPQRVLEEIRWHMDRFGVRDFHIQDENFAVDRKRVEEICRGLIDGGFGITFCFPSGLKMETLDRELLELLARSGVDEVVMPVMTPFPATASMNDPELQGFREMDELCFSPVWRRDYRKLDGFRRWTYVHFYVVRLLHHPLSFLAMLGRIFTGRSRTKGEMTARRMVRDLLDKLASLGGPEVE